MLSRKKRYLQVALNSTPYEGSQIISALPVSDRILIEAGTPLIKDYGSDGIKHLFNSWQDRISYSGQIITPYVVADTKCMDRGKREVEIAVNGHASAATVLGIAPVETINIFIESCKASNIDSMIDMIGVDQPFKVLRQLRKLPTAVILHRGVDEETYNKDKPLPYLQINKIRSSFNVMIAMAGGDTIREVQRAIFNDVDIAIVWKDFYNKTSETSSLANQFLAEIK